MSIETIALARAVAAGSLVLAAECGLIALWMKRKTLYEALKSTVSRKHVDRRTTSRKRTRAALAAILCAVMVATPAMLPIQAHALKLPKGYGLSKKDAKSYSRKNMYRKIKTPKCWRTRCTVKPKKFRTWGVIHAKGLTWTWYSQKVLPGGGLRIRGRHLDQRGYVVDWKGRIVLASNEIKRGTVLKTPFGADGIVLDNGCSGVVDVYTSWG